LDTFSGAVYADIQVRREAWSAMFVIFGLMGVGFSMTIDSAPPDGPPEAALGAAAVVSPAPPSWPWRRAALFLAGAAQLITISALVGADPIAATWSSLLLAVAPAPLAAAAAFAPAPVNLLAAVAGIAVLVAGITGQLIHTGLFFLPALVMLAAAAVKLRREQALGAGEGES
jgi:hypothetical protein